MVRKFKFSLIFKGSFLKEKSATFTPQHPNKYFTLKDCLFGSNKLAKNADPDKYLYSGHGIGFDLSSEIH